MPARHSFTMPILQPKSWQNFFRRSCNSPFRNKRQNHRHRDLTHSPPLRQRRNPRNPSRRIPPLHLLHRQLDKRKTTPTRRQRQATQAPTLVQKPPHHQMLPQSPKTKTNSTAIPENKTRLAKKRRTNLQRHRTKTTTNRQTLHSSRHTKKASTKETNMNKA